MGEVEVGHLDELPLGADALEEHDEVEAEEDDRIDGWTTSLGVTVRDPGAHKAEIECGVKLAVEVATWDESLEGDDD